MDVNLNFVESKNWDPDKMPEVLRWLRHNDPIHWSDKSNLWVLTRFEDCSYVSKNQDIFTPGGE